MESIVMDQSSATPRRSFIAPNLYANIHGGGIFNGAINQFHNVQPASGIEFFDPRAAPLRLHSFSVSSFHQQPPLLPLPVANSVAPLLPLPVANSVANTTGAVRTRQNKKKPRKPIRTSVAIRSEPKMVEKTNLQKGDEDPDDGYSCWPSYSISPPPSSVPLPKFILTGIRGSAPSGGVAVKPNTKGETDSRIKAAFSNTLSPISLPYKQSTSDEERDPSTHGLDSRLKQALKIN